MYRHGLCWNLWLKFQKSADSQPFLKWPKITLLKEKNTKMALAQLLLSMEPKYICHKLCTMGTSSPMVPILSTEILPIPAFTKSYGEVPLKNAPLWTSLRRKYHLVANVELMILKPLLDHNTWRVLFKRRYIMISMTNTYFDTYFQKCISCLPDFHG